MSIAFTLGWGLFLFVCCCFLNRHKDLLKSTLRMRDMADNTDDATKDPDILQHLSEAHLQNPMVREDPK